MDRHLLDILRCPITGQPLRLLNRQELSRLNERIAAGEISYENGDRPPAAFDEALITGNGSWIYAVQDGVPVMLPDQAVAAGSLDLEDHAHG